MTEREALQETLARWKGGYLNIHTRYHEGGYRSFTACTELPCHEFNWWVAELRREGLPV